MKCGCCGRLVPIFLVSTCAITALWILATRASHTHRPDIVWKAPSGETDMMVSWTGSGQIVVLTRRSAGDSWSLREISRSGAQRWRKDDAFPPGALSLVGAARGGRVLALNHYDLTEPKRQSSAMVVDVGARRVDVLRSGWFFPLGLAGSSTPLSASGQRAVIFPIIPGRPASIVDLASGRNVIEIGGSLDPGAGWTVRWRGESSLVWYDGKVGKLLWGGEEAEDTLSQCTLPVLRHAEQGVLSPNGSLLAVFARSDPRRTDIVIYDTASGAMHSKSAIPLADKESVHALVWSPYGDQLVALTSDTERLLGSNIYVVSTGGSVRRIEGGDYRFTPIPDGLSWSADGQLLAAALYDSKCRPALAVIRLSQ
jgi:hypothetical protein